MLPEDRSRPLTHTPRNIQEALATLAELAWRAGPVSGPVKPTTAHGDGASRAEREDLRLEGLGEAQYRALIEQIPAVTFVASLAGGRNALYVSPQIEALLGFSQKEWVADPVLWYRQTHPDDRARVSAKFAKTTLTGLPFREVFRVFSKSGKTVWVDAEARFVRDENGQLLFLHGVGFDVTEQVHAREAREALIRAQVAKAESDRARLQVEEALRVRDEFFDLASHELRTPVTSILGQAQLAKRRVERAGEVDTKTILGSLEVIIHQGGRLAQLITQLLDVSRLEGGKLTINPELTDLVPLVDQAVASARLLSARHEFTFQTPALLEAEVDSLRLEQVITNLLDNAVKYSPRGGTIEVKLAQDIDSMTLSVRDHGLGIPPDRRDRIFERFYQAHGDQVGSGLGLGLYISRQIVDLHGGTLSAEFPSDGGTRMVVRLPLRRPRRPKPDGPGKDGS